MDKSKTQTTSRQVEDAFTPSEQGGITPAHSHSLQGNLKMGRGERLAFLIMRLGPRPFELLSIVLLSAGINLITALLDVSSLPWTRFITAVFFTLAGVLFFIVSAYIELCYSGARDQQRIQIELKRQDSPQAVASLPLLATDILRSNKKRLRLNFLSLFLAVIFLLGGVGTLIFGISQTPKSAIQNASEPNNPADENPIKNEEKKP